MRTTALTFVLLLGCVSCSNSTDTATKNSTGTTTTTASMTSVTVSDKATGNWNGTSACVNNGPSTPAGGTPATEGVEGTLQFGKLDQTHQEGCQTYATRPGVGGAHNAAWANCGFYATPVPDENAVHSLEHGAVWIAYDPKIDAASLKGIRAATQTGTHILASPYSDLASPIMMSAWSRQLSLESVDDPRFQQFIDVYVQGPQTPELGAACKGGLGTPE
jgi:hypothetical protein